MKKSSIVISILSMLLFINIPFTPIYSQDFYEGTPISMQRWKNFQRNSYFGLRFGLNVADIRFRGMGGEPNTNPLPRFNVGLVYGHKLGQGLPFFIESGLVYTEKGSKLAATSEIEKKECHLKYIEIPLLLKYKIDTYTDDLSIQPFFGGFGSIAVGGKTKCYESRTKISSFGNDRFSRYDAGVRVGCGMAFQNFYMEILYDVGLLNIAGSEYTDYHYDDFEDNIRTGNLSVNLGINF